MNITNYLYNTRVKTSGFTLIELLVVVLIIGILAAIALPQYQTAVEKSRAAEALINLRTLHGSVERYYLENSSYPNDFSTLDLGFGANCSGDGCVHGKYYYYLGYIASGKDILAYKGTSRDVNAFALGMFTQDTTISSFALRAGDITCNTRNDDKLKKICLSLGGKSNFMNAGNLTYVIGR
ncbi:prepilin-type N-terminal cleavage/methylation domain-containing protein [Elusimicrobium posterum]|uniref:type IV pilin protein n=1 Tax=Elusimicrobium posterum TaxID=3116653 RepID=UPI003C725E16